ncbi:MAG: HAMP domain-containing protein [Deltaproteobacteria bacterium]|nr:HAMP domain-containing protein [Deltaproteobacteria bacterium]
MHLYKKIFNLKNKLVFLFLVLAVVPPLVFGIFSIKTTEAVINNLLSRQIENIAADKAVILERWLQERKQDMQVIAGTSIVKSMEPALMAPYLDLVRDQYNVYNDISIFSDKNEPVYSTGDYPQGPEIAVADSDHQDSLAAPQVKYLPEEKESTFQLIAPVYENGQKIGSVLGTVGTHNIISIILHVSLGETGECYLVDRNGTFLAHKEPWRILSENISHSGSFKNTFGPGERKNIYRDYRNIEVLGRSHRVEGTDWYIVVEQDKAEAFKSADSMKRLIGFMMLTAIGSAFVLTWVISYHFIRPVQGLSRSAKILAQSEYFPEELDTRRSDEIGVLYRAFNDMARKIKQRQDTLVEKINLKSAELEETGETLKHFKIIAEQSEKFAALGRLGAAVAHEIRTPLTSLKLFLESIQGEIEISPEFIEDFGIAMGQISRIEAAINRLLDYTKPKEMEFSNISTGYLIRDVVSLVRPMANKQECTIETMVAPNLPEIRGDIKLLEEALINLFINALEVMPEKGRIYIRVSLTECRLAEEGENPVSAVRIDVEDSGPGISPENLIYIFDPFFTTKAAGTGLGLPTVFNTIKRHNGEITAANRPEGGACFSIFLPVISEG